MEKSDYKKMIRSYIMNAKFDYCEYLHDKYCKFKYVCVWGMGNMGSYLPEKLITHNIKVDFFCDNNEEKIARKEYRGIPCISFEELCKYKDETIVIVATRYYKEIYAQLIESGFHNIDRIFDGKFDLAIFLKKNNIKKITEKMLEVIDILEDEESCRVYTRIIQEWVRNEYKYGQLDDIFTEPQYFVEGIIKRDAIRNFADCGAYDGDTLDDYVAYIGENGFDKVYLFELSKENCKKLINNIELKYKTCIDKLIVENKGVSDRNEKIEYFDEDEGSRLTEKGNTEGEIISIDSYFNNIEVDFIKMDIEGEELKALEGAKNVIKNQSPQLAICIYHKPEDIYEIPLKIREFKSDYKIYIRHHTDLLNETVCYAIK